MTKQKTKGSFAAALGAAFPHTIPVLTGFLILGLAYGLLMASKGYGPLWSTLMSAIAFCGSMQYVAITLLTTAFDPLQAFLLSLMVNARHLFYGISMLDRYRGTGKWKPFLIYTMCDETFSLTSGLTPPEGIEAKHFYGAISLLNYSYWVIGTFLGGVAGSWLTFNTKGLDFALTALFVVLFIEQLRDKASTVSGVLGLAAAVAALAVFGAENMVIPAMILILAGLLLGRRWLWS